MIVSYQVCSGCGIRYLQADFLPHRVAGYCTEECWHHEPRGVPTAEDIGWKNGIAAASQRKRIAPAQPSDAPPRQWLFDMVHHPRPIGWQLENWRLADTCPKDDPRKRPEPPLNSKREGKNGSRESQCVMTRVSYT
jgi:hypothetical protein